MRKTAYLIILSAVLVLSGCSLDRSNPLDPNANDIQVPPSITGLLLASNVAGTVNIKCDRYADVSKYKIYRSLSYDGSYLMIAEVIQPGQNTKPEYVDENVQPNGYYYYKVSGVNAQGLEGPISPYKGIRVKM